MISEEGFRRYLQPRIDAGIPFSAYWHPNGFGVLITGPIPTERIVHGVKVPGKPIRVSKTKLARWRAINEKYRRAGTRLITVEFDDVNLMTEGGYEPWSL